MSLRRTVRQAIKAGTTMYATVESYHLGLATVRLHENGARLTNLSTIGGEVEIGQTVIVDYSAGVNPIVRPEFVTEETDTLEPVLQEVFEPREIPVEDEDYGCCAWQEGAGIADFWLYDAQPFIVPFGYNMDYEGYHAGSWDTGGWIDWTANPGRDYLLVPRDGKYIINISWSDFWTNVDPGNISGYCKVRVLVNGSPILEFYGRDGEGLWYQQGLSALMIDELSQGDHVQLEWTIFFGGNYHLDYWAAYEYDSRSIKLQYIPGT